MESKDISWTTFYNEPHISYSSEFQTELSNQLMQRFNALVGIDNFALDQGFMLFVGMNELKTMYKDGHTFAFVEIISRTSRAKILTIYWKTDNNEDAPQSKLLRSANIEFGFCSDFDKDYFLSFAKEKVIKKINGTKLKFKYLADYQLLPDLRFTYSFKSTPTDAQLTVLTDLFSKYCPDVYVSEIALELEKHVGYVDFQRTEFDLGVAQIEQFILDLNADEVCEIIEKIRIE